MTLDIVTFAWMTDESGVPKNERHSWWENQRDLMRLYAINLANGIDRTLNRHHRKILFTNRRDWFDDLGHRFHIIDMEPVYKRITNKFIAYDPAYDISEKMVLTDLDMAFVQNWDDLADYDGNLIMNHTGGARRGLRWYPGGGFIMTNNRTGLFDKITAPLYENPEAVYKRCNYRERHWFAKQIGRKNIDYWQKAYPGSIGSYKKDIVKRKGSFEDFKIIWFHGDPRPDTVPEVAKYWK
ncbi:hypothetical protein [Solemya velum gill symbiont]|uniref:Glycosyltransferase n=1 Tax=Solemya velum gill symbiont TaxID=2340 RepID=A0A1T2FMP0_SOVGS|nr:hypothetical protein [Solemya velum gill symbiont]OOY35100.1 hypothetical protein BOV88_06160 [Solemya velum gill symbiont]OOY37883.1 hypothetical protein BOV89_05545 [Solemya velum gill symbiont]OOY39318.1 hypothetical protein BOV90_09945 [Solemya velum gill symbiont]OOY46682.1 hypothetical protein BOV92_02730 [Solemya velum gill symbiont]OOY47106.1 hypothetical protein BOV93_08025 [Solemya velum gill symbiont]